MLMTVFRRFGGSCGGCSGGRHSGFRSGGSGRRISSNLAAAFAALGCIICSGGMVFSLLNDIAAPGTHAPVLLAGVHPYDFKVIVLGILGQFFRADVADAIRQAVCHMTLRSLLIAAKPAFFPVTIFIAQEHVIMGRLQVGIFFAAIPAEGAAFFITGDGMLVNELFIAAMHAHPVMTVFLRYIFFIPVYCHAGILLAAIVAAVFIAVVFAGTNIDLLIAFRADLVMLAVFKQPFAHFMLDPIAEHQRAFLSAAGTGGSAAGIGVVITFPLYHDAALFTGAAVSMGIGIAGGSIGSSARRDPVGFCPFAAAALAGHAVPRTVALILVGSAIPVMLDGFLCVTAIRAAIGAQHTVFTEPALLMGKHFAIAAIANRAYILVADASIALPHHDILAAGRAGRFVEFVLAHAAHGIVVAVLFRIGYITAAGRAGNGFARNRASTQAAAQAVGAFTEVSHILGARNARFSLSKRHKAYRTVFRMGIVAIPTVSTALMFFRFAYHCPAIQAGQSMILIEHPVLIDEFHAQIFMGTCFFGMGMMCGGKRAAHQRQTQRHHAEPRKNLLHESPSVY